MEFNDVEIYYKFRDIFYKQKKNWYLFIKELDIGIISLNYHHNLYKIIDEKKWLLAKIKYGF
jgi:hypothetical protein